MDITSINGGTYNLIGPYFLYTRNEKINTMSLHTFLCLFSSKNYIDKVLVLGHDFNFDKRY